jgi:hypothetical protein
VRTDRNRTEVGRTVVSVMSSRWTAGFLGILIVWSVVALLSGMSFRDLEAAGQSGDSYGVLNGLFGGLTLLGVAYGASLEFRQLRRARREARASGKERKRSLEIQLATAELAAMNNVAEYYRQRVTPESEQLMVSVFPHLDEGNACVKYNRYQQLIRSKLAELRSPGFDWQEVGVTPRNGKNRTLRAAVSEEMTHRSPADPRPFGNLPLADALLG